MTPKSDPDQPEENVRSLNKERTRRFLKLLAEDPFVAVVVTDGEVRVFSKNIEPDHLARIKEALTDMSDDEGSA
jgi:hypothetical protein